MLDSKLVLVPALGNKPVQALDSKLVLVQALGNKPVLALVLGSKLVLVHKLELVRSKLGQVHSNRSLPYGSRTSQLRW